MGVPENPVGSGPMEQEATIKGEYVDPDESPNQKQQRERIERLEEELKIVREEVAAIRQQPHQGV